MIRLTLGFFVLMAFSVTIATIAMTSEASAPSCIQSKTDPYDIGVVMSTGSYKGQCMDLSSRRPAVILSENDQELTIANFYHDKEFWIATVPKSGVARVIFQIAHFPNPIPMVKFAHTQLRLILAPGVSIKLTPQDRASKSAPVELNDLAIVDQIDEPKELMGSYNPIKGLKSTYASVIRVMGSLDRAQEELGGPQDTTRQFELTMKDQEKDAILLNGIRLSAQQGYDTSYQLFSSNCTTSAFAILDQSVHYPRRVKRFKIRPRDIHDPIEGPSLRALKARMLIDHELPTWNEETGLR